MMFRVIILMVFASFIASLAEITYRTSIVTDQAFPLGLFSLYLTSLIAVGYVLFFFKMDK